MNNSQIRAFVRQLIVEAKEAKVKAKTKKKISVSDHIKMIDEAGDRAATEAKTTEVTKMIQAVERIKKTIAELEHFDKIVGVATIKSLNSDLDKSLAELNKKKDELEKTPSDKKKEIVDETRFEKVIKKESIHNTPQMGGVTVSKGTAGYVDKIDKKGGDYNPKERASNLAKLKDFGPKKKNNNG
jgi:hypothetical protein